MESKAPSLDPERHPSLISGHGDALTVVSISFGLFPEATHLNSRFVTGRTRVKLTLDVRRPAGGPSLSRLLALLAPMLPGLSRHRCCGAASFERSIRTRGHRTGCGEAGADDAVDIAHLMEHIVIDLQCLIADMDRCSGVTCGLKHPLHRFDLFIESPGKRVSLLCVAMSRTLLEDLLWGAEPDPCFEGALGLARHFERSAGAAIAASVALQLAGEGGRGGESLRRLVQEGFVGQVQECLNFSGLPLYQRAAEPEQP